MFKFFFNDTQLNIIMLLEIIFGFLYIIIKKIKERIIIEKRDIFKELQKYFFLQNMEDAATTILRLLNKSRRFISKFSRRNAYDMKYIFICFKILDKNISFRVKCIQRFFFVSNHKNFNKKYIIDNDKDYCFKFAQYNMNLQFLQLIY